MPHGKNPDSLLIRLRRSAYLAAAVAYQSRVPFRPRPEVDRMQGRRVRAAVNYAYQHVPFYREAMRRMGIAPGDIRNVADLSRLPLVERDHLQRDPEYFVTRDIPPDSLVKVRSGGGSGQPVTVFHDRFSLLHGAAFRERRRIIAMKLAGKRLRLRQTSITSPLSMAPLARRVVSSAGVVPPSVRVVQRNLSVLDPPAWNLQRINEFRPDLLTGFGSYIEALFVHLRHEGADFHRPAAVFYGADPVSGSVRKLVMDTFCIPIFSGYGAAEAFDIAFECEAHRGLHVNDDFAPVRLVNEDGTDVPAGESGEVVVSNLVNRGTVLLNYRLGDLATSVPGDCSCGRSLPSISLIQGRVDEWLESPAGEPVHPHAVRSLFDDEEAIYRFRVVQRSPSHFAVSLVAKGNCDRHGIETRLTRGFVDRFGPDTTLEFAYVESLPRTERGKVRTVVSSRSSVGAS